MHRGWRILALLVWTPGSRLVRWHGVVQLQLVQRLFRSLAGDCHAWSTYLMLGPSMPQPQGGALRVFLAVGHLACLLVTFQTWDFSFEEVSEDCPP